MIRRYLCAWLADKLAQRRQTALEQGQFALAATLLDDIVTLRMKARQ